MKFFSQILEHVGMRSVHSVRLLSVISASEVRPHGQWMTDDGRSLHGRHGPSWHGRRQRWFPHLSNLQNAQLCRLCQNVVCGTWKICIMTLLKCINLQQANSFEKIIAGLDYAFCSMACNYYDHFGDLAAFLWTQKIEYGHVHLQLITSIHINSSQHQSIHEYCQALDLNLYYKSLCLIAIRQQLFKLVILYMSAFLIYSNYTVTKSQYCNKKLWLKSKRHFNYPLRWNFRKSSLNITSRVISWYKATDMTILVLCMLWENRSCQVTSW